MFQIQSGGERRDDPGHLQEKTDRRRGDHAPETRGEKNQRLKKRNQTIIRTMTSTIRVNTKTTKS